MARRRLNFKKVDEDPRMDCTMADGGGDRATYKLAGHDELVIEFDLRDPDYPWTVCPIENGRLVSGIFNSYQTSYDACNAVEDGTWNL